MALNKTRLGFVALVLPLLAACSSMSRLEDPAYAPVQPPAPMPPPVATGSIYNASTSVMLFEDVKARRVGDLITVILEEKTKASKKANTSTSKETNINLPSPKLFGYDPLWNGKEVLSAVVDSEQDFDGSGDSSQSNSLSGNITVTVAGVYPNGNLLVRGEKLLTLNQGSEVVRISGIVRPVDVKPDNTVLSTQIANAQITYSGNGMVADSNKAGWLTRFFNSGWWPL